MNINKKGFTIVELLATIVVLMIISGLAITAYSKYIASAKKEKNNENISLVENAAKSYLKNNSTFLPREIGESNTVLISVLKQEKYITEEVVNSKGETCTNDSYVLVTKKSNNEYSYDVHIYYNEEDKNNDVSTTSSTEAKVTVTFSNNTSDVSNTTFNMNISSGASSRFIVSYSYDIAVKGSSSDNYTEMYSSGTIAGNNQKTIKFQSMSLDKYVDLIGTTYVKITVRVITSDSDDNYKETIKEFSTENASEEDKKNYEDKDHPICVAGSEIVDPPLSQVQWINRNYYKENKKGRSITVNCSDGEGSGCVRDKYTRTWPYGNNNTIVTDNIRVYDNKGNHYDCNYHVNVDIETPKAVISAYKSYTNTKVYSGLEVNDSVLDSNGGKYVIGASQYSDTYGDGYWLNKTNYPNGIMYKVVMSDKLLAGYKWETNLGGSENSYENYDSKVTSKTIYVYLTAEGRRYGKLTVYDTAGNENIIEVYANIDRTVPTSPTVNLYKWNTNNRSNPTNSTGLGTYTANTWSNMNIFTKASGSTDSLSGLSGYQHTTTGVTENTTDHNGSYRSIKAEGVSTIKYRACDRAGNCTVYSPAYTVKIDKTPPSNPAISMYKWNNNNDTRPSSSTGLSSYNSNTWSNKNIFTKASGSTDSLSGLNKYQYKTSGRTNNETDHNGSYRNIEVEGTSYIQYKACDNAGNCTNYYPSSALIIKIDKTPPTLPTTQLYKWRNDDGSSPTSSTGLGTYTENTWSNKYIFTKASGSTDSLSGFDKYEYTTTGVTANETNKVGSYRNVKAQGISTIKYRACDNVGNCSVYNSPKTVKIDKTPPTAFTVHMYKWSNNSGTAPTSNSGLSSYTSNTWSNKYIYTYVSGSTDSLSGFSGYQYTTTGQTANDTNKSGSYRHVKAEGTSTIKYRACDNVGNCTNYGNVLTIKIDKTAPTKPTTNLYKWKNSTAPTSSSGLDSYTSNTWSNKKIYTTASGSTDDLSGVSGYQYTTTGQTANDTNKNGSYRHVKAEGTSTIKYRACDSAGNCSAYNGAKTIKIDLTAPSISWTSKSSNYDHTLTVTDSTSGVKKYKMGSASEKTLSSSKSSYTVKYYIVTSKKGKNDSTYGTMTFTAKDAAGNSASKSGNIYRRCNSVKQNQTDKVYNSNDKDKLEVEVFHWSNAVEHCNKNDKANLYRTYDFREVKCLCNIDSYNNSYCSLKKADDITTLTHGSSKTARIYYNNSDNGYKACVRSDNDHKVNSYVRQVCDNGIYDAGATVLYFHGYAFYKGAIPKGGHGSFAPTEHWTQRVYNKIDVNRAAASANGHTACEGACEQRYGKDTYIKEHS